MTSKARGGVPARPAVIDCRPWIAILIATSFGISLPRLITRASQMHGDLIAYYLASRRMLAGEDPYLESRVFLEYLYPPFFAFAITPMAMLSPAEYAVCWWILLGIAWLAGAQLVRVILGRGSAPWTWTLDLLPHLAVVRFVWNGWGHGQVALLTAVLMLAAVLCMQRARTRMSALALAVGGAIKVYPLYLAVAFLRLRKPAGMLWLAVFSSPLAGSSARGGLGAESPSRGGRLLRTRAGYRRSAGGNAGKVPRAGDHRPAVGYR
jgi:hypothetical protein